MLNLLEAMSIDTDDVYISIKIDTLDYIQYIDPREDYMVSDAFYGDVFFTISENDFFTLRELKNLKYSINYLFIFLKKVEVC